MVTGTNVAYIAATSGRPIPLATDGVHRTPTPTTPKPTGLDWDALTPTCHGCGTKSGQLGDNGLCPTCRGITPAKVKKTRKQGYAAAQLPESELLRRFTGPDDTAVGRDLAELEATDPKVTAAAAASLEDAADRMIRPDDHVRPEHLEADPETSTPAPGNTGAPVSDRPADAVMRDGTNRGPGGEPSSEGAEVETTPYTAEANLDAQIAHATRVLRDTATSDDHVVRLLRLNVLSTIEALYLYTQLNPTQTPAPAAHIPRRAGAGHTTPERDGRRSVEERPAAATAGEGVPRPATRRPSRRVDADRIVELYTAGKYMHEIQTETGNAVSTIKRVLVDAGVPLRPRGPRPGDRHKTYDPALVDDVRRLYADEHLTQAQVADRLGIGVKVVQNVMAAGQITARPTAVDLSKAGIGHPIKIQPDQHQTIVDRYRDGEPATSIARDYDVDPASIYPILDRYGVERHGRRVAPGVDTLGRLRDAIDATGATSRQIKDWAITEGLITTISRGLPHLRLVEAYAAAHQTGEPTP